jgi:hypothetical protein
VKSISLKSVELPILFSNLRVENNSYQMTFSFTYSTYTVVSARIVIGAKNFTSAADLIAAINSAFTSYTVSYGALSIQFALDSNFPRINLITNATTLTIFNSSMLFNTIMGFNATNQVSFTAGTYYATSYYNLSPDNYLIMQIMNVNTPYVNATGMVGTFKIPINGVQGSVIYFAENGGFKQEIENKDTHMVFDKLTIRITDRWGVPIDPKGGDFSFTLGFTYDKVY